MNQSNKFNDLDWGDRLLTLGYCKISFHRSHPISSDGIHLIS